MQAVPKAKASDVSFNEGVLRLAAVHSRRVEFRYVRAVGAPPESRVLIPEGISESVSGKTLVVGTDTDRNDYRAYRLDRIKGDVEFA
jgi:predicted DNA-binding transcriptional regulator YafY